MLYTHVLGIQSFRHFMYKTNRILLFLWLGLILLIAYGCGSQTASNSSTSSLDSSMTQADTLPEDEVKTILFFGNSLTAGYGLELSNAFPALIQKKIDSLGLPYHVVNAGLSGETTADGLSRIDWLLDQKVSIFVLELGANDGLRGLSPAQTRKNLKAIIGQVRAKYPSAKVLLCGMEVPPNLGEPYTQQFRSIFPDISDSLDTRLVPFLLEGVAGEPELNLPDGIHPTAKGHQIVAQNVWEHLKPML